MQKRKNREKIKQKYEEATLNIGKKLLSKPIENKNSINYGQHKLSLESKNNYQQRKNMIKTAISKKNLDMIPAVKKFGGESECLVLSFCFILTF